MVKLLLSYPVPHDRDAFHHRFEDELWVAMERIPGCRKRRVTVPLEADATRPFHVLAELYFDDADALRAALASPEGEAYVALEREVSTGGAPRRDACIEHEA